MEKAMSKILTIPLEYLRDLELPRNGVKRINIGHLHSMIIHEGMFIDREQAERDTKYKQIIPYIVVRRPSFVPPLEGQQGPEVMSYQRTKLSGEQRLAGKHSIGFGGHIEEQDGKSALLCLTRGMTREIEEEISFPEDVTHDFPAFGCLINDDTTDVGQVHLGLLYMLDIKEEKKDARLNITSPDDNISDIKWSKPAALDTSLFEMWSQIVLKNVFEVG
jgi:predicted NUDIX family phosphoesterase